MGEYTTMHPLSIQNKEHCINQEIFDKATESFKSVQKKLKPVSRPGYAIAGISSR